MAGLLDLLKPQQVGGLLGSADNRTLLGLQMLANSGPSLTPRSGFEGIPELAAGMQQRQQQQRLMEDEKQRQSQLSSALVNAMPGLNPQLAQADPNMALKVFQAQQPKQKELPSSVQEYLYAQQNPGFVDYQTNMRRANQPNININPGEKAFESEMGKQAATRYQEIQQLGQAGRDSLGSVSMMRTLMQDPNFYSGAGGEMVLAGKKIVSSLGGDANAVSSMETFNAESKKLALSNMGGSLGSGFSNADRDFVTGQVPSVDNTPEGNKLLLSVNERIAQRKVEVARMAQQYVQRNGRLDPGFDAMVAEYAERNPLFNDLPVKKKPGKSLPPNADVNALIDHYGD
jgi:hypothetical protein